MHSIANANFWRRTPPAARPALLATLVVFGVGLASFVALVWAESAYFGVSPLTVITAPPGPGAPTVWVGMVILAVALQASATVALRRRAAVPRVIGAVVAFGIAALCLTFLVAAILALVDYWTVGTLPGDFGDLLGIVLFGVPLALVIGGLNTRAFLLELREFFR
jgi:hypothetical protein